MSLIFTKENTKDEFNVILITIYHVHMFNLYYMLSLISQCHRLSTFVWKLCQLFTIFIRLLNVTKPLIGIFSCPGITWKQVLDYLFCLVK